MTEETVDNVTVEPIEAELDAMVQPEQEVVEESPPEVVPEAEKKEEEHQPEKMVPLGALHEARMINRQLRGKMEQMEQRFSSIMERIAPPEQDTGPKKEDDPIAYYDQKISQLESQIKQREAIEKQQQQYQGIVGAYKAAAAEVRQSVPDFDDAYKHLIGLRTNAYVEQGYDLDQAASIVQREEAQTVQMALNMGMNPAAVIYNFAKSAGFQGKPKEAPKPDLETVQKGVAASKSLSTAKGKGEQNLTLEAVASMTDEDFDKFWNTVMIKT